MDADNNGVGYYWRALDGMAMDYEHRTFLYGHRRWNHLLSWIWLFLTLLPLPIPRGFAESSPASPVRIAADVQSNIFSYEVENRSGRAILGIRFPQQGTYSYTLPDGWDKRVDGPILHAWTDQPSKSIRPGDKGRFSMRVSSYGAVLGKGSIIVELGKGQTLTVPDIWVPVKEPTGYIGLVAGCILAILLTHAAGSGLLARRARRRQAR
jgi:hypothetical protein